MGYSDSSLWVNSARSDRGLGLAAVMGQGFLRMFLYSVEPADPASFIGAADPLVSLHYE